MTEDGDAEDDAEDEAQDEAQDDAEWVAGSLTRWINSVSFVDRSADEVTELLIEAVVWWAQEEGWRAYRKARSVFPLPPPFEHRYSFVDVGIARRDCAPIVVEVDRSDRKRTLEKLVAEAERGRVALWLRWGTGTFATPPAPVRLIPCRVEAHKDAEGHKVFSTPTLAKPAPRHSGVDLSQAEQTDLFE
ncbi:MAG TPA: hypothetical protein VFC19_23120 [Candidatus Limnocylindrales bacterium]|nr:hypothetical protein [Candidatus Limnocylindrales bacterium]